jgi:hypothetical protein
VLGFAHTLAGWHFPYIVLWGDFISLSTASHSDKGTTSPPLDSRLLVVTSQPSSRQPSFLPQLHLPRIHLYTPGGWLALLPRPLGSSQLTLKSNSLVSISRLQAGLLLLPPILWAALISPTYVHPLSLLTPSPPLDSRLQTDDSHLMMNKSINLSACYKFMLAMLFLTILQNNYVILNSEP